MTNKKIQKTRSKVKVGIEVKFYRPIRLSNKLPDTFSRDHVSKKTTSFHKPSHSHNTFRNVLSIDMKKNVKKSPVMNNMKNDHLIFR